MLYKDLPVRGKPVTLEWERQRFKCTEKACRSMQARDQALALIQHDTLDRYQAPIGHERIGLALHGQAVDLETDVRQSHWPVSVNRQGLPQRPQLYLYSPLTPDVWGIDVQTISGSEQRHASDGHAARRAAFGL